MSKYGNKLPRESPSVFPKTRGKTIDLVIFPMHASSVISPTLAQAYFTEVLCP